jgi:outer membrane autotransporter protein
MAPCGVSTKTSLRLRAITGRRKAISAVSHVLVLLVTSAGVSAVWGANCPSNAGEYTNGGAACSIPAGTAVSRITATGSGAIQANGIAIAVPYGIAVTAQNGGAVLFGVDPQAGPSTLSELYAGSGGITGLLANGTNSQIIASGLAINLPASGITIALAENGGQITLNDGSTINLNSGGGSLGLVASGAGSSITADDMTLRGQTGGGDRAVHSTGGAAIDLTNSTVSLTSQGGGVIGVLVDSASSFGMNNTGITVTGGGNIVGVDAAGGSNVTLNGGSVTANSGVIPPATRSVQISSAIVAEDAGTTLSATGTTIIVNAAQAAAAGIVQNGGTMAINGGSVQANGSASVGFLIQGAAGVANTLGLNGTTVSSGAGSFSVQGAVADIALDGSTVIGNNGSLLATQSGATSTFDAGDSLLSGAITTDSSSTANVTLHDGTDWTMTGNSNMTSLMNSDSIIRFTAPTGDPTQLASYKTLITGSYVGATGTVELNTYLGSDGSPSDRLIVDGGPASGTTSLVIRNTTGEGASTTSNGILVVQTANGGTTAPTAFMLGGEARAGAFDYGLFRGGINGTSPDDWFLRSDFVVSGIKPFAPLQPAPPGFEVTEPAIPTQPAPPGGTVTPAIPNQPVPPGSVVPEPAEPPPSPGGSVDAESPELSVDPPPAVLPPGTYPIIGPELATDSVVQPIARQMGLAMLGTLHERIGDTFADPDAGADGWTQSSWGRLFGQQIDNRYRAFVDPQASGQLLGVQAGLDIWRGSLIPGQRDAAGAYFAYANSTLNVNGLVTDLDVDSYVQVQTGKIDLDAYSGGLYWTHYGPNGWYIDAVLQGTHYDGNATTETARLPISGYGVASSLEAGYPIPLPLGPRFVFEPQMQVIWQHVSFSGANDGLGPVDLGSTSGTTGRLGVRGRWSIDGRNGQVWEPYGRINLWHDWGGRATTVYGEDSIPLLEQATRLEFAGGVTTQIDKRLDAYLQAGYQFAVGDTDGGRRQGVQGDAGVRYKW